jgi:TPR repeat protein
MKKRGADYVFKFLAVLVISLAWSAGVFAAVVLVDSETKNAFDLYKEGKTEQAIPIITMKAYQGVIAAQYNLAVIYAQNQSSDLDRQEFRFWLHKVAASGDAEGQFNLAMLYYSDQQEENRLEHTVSWLTKAARNDYVKAQYNLGYLVFSNLEIGISRQTVVEWLNRAARAGNDRAKTLAALLQENKSDGAPKMYGMDLQLRAAKDAVVYAIKYDDTEIYAFPATRQKSLLVLDKDVRVEIAEKRDDWLGIRVEGGFPSWIAREELDVRGATATVTGLEASMYVEPVIDKEVFKVGVVSSEEILKVLDSRNGWVKVTTPDHFLAWVKESDVMALADE